MNKNIPESFDKEEEIPESFWEALFGFRNQDLEEARELFQTAMELAKKYKDERDDARLEWDHCLNLANKLLKERDKYKIGHDRYEKLRRLNLQEMKELYLKHLHFLEPFDTLVDKLCQVKSSQSILTKP